MPAFTLTLSATGTFDIIDEPIINGFSPTSGKSGDTIDIIGKNLKNISSITLAGLTAESYTVLSDTKIQAKLPSGNSNKGKVCVTTVGGTATSSDDFTFIGTPSITTINPNSGFIGSDIIVTGNNLNDVNSVTYNDNKIASFKVISETELSTKVPVGATTGPVTITSPGGQAKSSDFTVVPSSPPVITSFSPVLGIIGTDVEITGLNFNNITSVKFFDNVSAEYTILSDTKIKTKVPVNADDGYITISNAAGSSNSPTTFNVVLAPPPTITSFSPSSGGVGSEININGTNFVAVSQVKVGNRNATYTVNSSNSITVVTPEGSGPVYITISADGGDVTSTTPYTIIPKPIITSFNPTSGSLNTLVRIIGSQLLNASSVKVNNIESSFNVISANNIDATIPNNATTGKISVTTPGGTTYTVSNFEVVNAPEITNINPKSVTIGSTVRITGKNYVNVSSVKINGVDSKYTVISSTDIDVVVPNTTSGKITINALGGSVTSTDNLTIIQKPEITSFTPTSGTYNSSIRITGNNFGDVTSVKFNEMSATYNIISSTEIVATVPTNATSGKLSLTNVAGTTYSTNSFTVTLPIPTITSFSPSTGTVGTSVDIVGTNFNNVTSVKFNSTEASSITVVDSTKIKAVIATGTKSGKITVTTNGGTVTSTNDFVVDSVPTLTWTPSTKTMNWYTEGNYGGTENSNVTQTTFSTVNVATVKTIEFTNRSDSTLITTLNNLSGYTNLLTLDLTYQDLSTINISGNTNLQDLYISYNELTTYNLSNNFKLINVDISNNELNDLLISNCTSLQNLNCSNNNLTSLNLSGTNQLINLDCSSNTAQFKTLDLSGKNNLQTLNCQENGLTTLDLSSCTSVINVNCYTNSMTGTLDISKLTKLQSISAYQNSISTLNLGTINSVKQIDLSFNQLSGTLDLSNLTSLEFLDLRKNKLTSVKLSTSNISTTNMYTFNVSENNLDVNSVNNILIALDSYNKTVDSASTITLSGGTNATPSGAGLTAKNNLIKKGWTVYTN